MQKFRWPPMGVMDASWPPLPLGASPSGACAHGRHTDRRRPIKRGDVATGSSRGGPVGLRPWRHPKSFVERQCAAPSRKCVSTVQSAQPQVSRARGVQERHATGSLWQEYAGHLAGDTVIRSDDEPSNEPSGGGN
jgi:hypothetical protein|eukprot:COSAG06_NODE_947_length_11359_cov_13.054707_4_plen_135_part_00